LERKETKRKQKKQRKKEEKNRKREKKRRKRHLKKYGAPLVRALTDLEPVMAGEEVIVVGRVVDESYAPSSLAPSSERTEKWQAKADGWKKEGKAGEEGEEDEIELSMEAIAKRKLKKAREQAVSGDHVDEAERAKRWEEEERRRRQAECWRALPYLNKNQDRFLLAKDGRDVILQFDKTLEGTFLPDNAQVWVWGKLEVGILTALFSTLLYCGVLMRTCRTTGEDRSAARAVCVEGSGRYDPAGRGDPGFRGAPP
jgi:hypothetical protein